MQQLRAPNNMCSESFVVSPVRHDYVFDGAARSDAKQSSNFNPAARARACLVFSNYSHVLALLHIDA